ncbi:MAG: hypothetical protein ACKOC8_09190 [Pirellulales bacterium]
MITDASWFADGAVVATVLDRVPGLVFGLPLVLVAAIVFAATHHEDAAAIRRAALEWVGWLVGILGGVLVAVWLIARMA